MMEALVGMESKLKTVASLKSARQETNVPWSHAGDLYRPCFRALEKEFRENPALKDVRSFATFCYEVNFLLAAFYDKRAYLPDNAYSTLSDNELEDRFLETLKINQLRPPEMPVFVQINFVLNYWMGCAKYWMTSDYQYSTPGDYTAEQWSELQTQSKQCPWLLCMPKSEMQRLSKKYEEIFTRESNRASHPDAIIVGLEKSIGMIPNPQWYREVYTNELFSVYVKNPLSSSPAPTATPAL